MRSHVPVRVGACIGIASRALSLTRLRSSPARFFEVCTNSSRVSHSFLRRSSRTPKASPMFQREKAMTSSPASALSKIVSTVWVPVSATYRFTIVLVSR